MGFALEQVDEFQRAYKLYLRGKSTAAIARELDISTIAAKGYVEQYKRFVNERLEQDPDFLERVEEHTLELLEEVKMLSSEAWDLYENVKLMELPTQMNAALKLAGDFTDKKAKLLQLMVPRQDHANLAKMQRLEKVNSVVSSIIKDIVAECPKCRQEAQVKLAEAFSLMDRADEVVEQEPIDDDEITDAEILQ